MRKEIQEKQHQYEKTLGEKDKIIGQTHNHLQEVKLELDNTQEEFDKVSLELSSKKKELVLKEDVIKQLE